MCCRLLVSEVAGQELVLFPAAHGSVIEAVAFGLIAGLQSLDARPRHGRPVRPDTRLFADLDEQFDRGSRGGSCFELDRGALHVGRLTASGPVMTEPAKETTLASASGRPKSRSRENCTRSFRSTASTVTAPGVWLANSC